MTKQSMKNPDDQRRKDEPQPARDSHPFDLKEVLRKSRAEALGSLAPHSF